MISRQSIIIHASLLLLGGVSWWLAETMLPADETASAPKYGPVDYYSKNVRRIDYGVDGKPKKALVARTMTHYKTDDRTELEKPVMTLNRRDGSAPWVIDSDSAVTLSGGEDIFLQGDVLITKETSNGDQLKIITRNVKYSPQKNYAETSEDVLMFTHQDELSGTGMQAQLEPDLVLKILGNVRRKHETR